MGINLLLRKEGIENIRKLDTMHINKIASFIAEKLCTSFPDLHLSQSELFIQISRLDMYVASMQDNASAKYVYGNNSIYFNENLDLNKNTQAAKYSRATEKEQASKELATYFGSSVSQNSNHDNVKLNSKSKVAPQTKQNDNDKFVVAGSILGTGIVSGFIVGGPFGGLVGGILAGSTLLFTSCSSDEKKSTAAPAKKQVTKPKTNGMRQIFKSNKVKITPVYVLDKSIFGVYTDRSNK